MVLEVVSLTKSYEGRAILREVSLRLAPGDTVALTGESGSGKSTLMHLIGALDQLDGGEITLNGTPYATLTDRSRAALRREQIGLVFQQFNLIASLSVRANLAFQARLAGRYDADWVQEIATRLGLAERLDQMPETLSGGQQQRVAIGRALAARPALLLADEPTGNLDETNGAAIMDLLFQLRDRDGATLVLVTHAAELAARCDRVLRLRDGRIETSQQAEAAE